MADHDLSKTIIPYLDRHLAFPLLAHLTEISLFPIEEVQAAQYELAKGTNMVDYAVSLFEELNPDKEVPAGKLLSFGLPFIVANNGFYRIQCQT
jgi:translation initiation factor 3 subunit E